MGASRSTSVACAIGVLALATPAMADDAPPAAAVTTATEAPPPDAPSVSGTSSQVTGVRVPLRVDLEHSPPLGRYYPREARRKPQEGSPGIFVCVSETGQLTSATLARSSGSRSLDEAALKWAADARYLPATQNGQALRACGSFRVRFHADGTELP